MDEFGMLAKDFGFRPQGKSAPMKSSAPDRRNRAASSSTAFKPDANDMFSDVFGGPPKYTNSNSKSTSSISDFDYDSIFKDSVSANANESKTKPKSSNSPVYDKPLYDDDIFDGLPGVKSKPGSSPASARYEDNIFASMTSSPPQQSQHSMHSDQFDDLLGNFGRTEKVEPIRVHSDKSSRGLDDLIPGFGSSSPASSSRWSSAPSPSSSGKTKEKSSTADDPFVVLESTSPSVASSQGHFTDPLEQLGKIGKSSSTKSGVTSPSDDVVETNSLNSFNKSPSAFSKETNNRKKDRSRTNSGEGSSVGSARSTVSREPMDEYSFGFGYSESQPQKASFDHFQESRPTVHVMSSNSPTSHTDASSRVGTSPKSEEHMQHTDEIWLTVSEIPLFTPVTRAPPPSRPPPPIPTTVDNDFFPSFSSAKYSQNANASRRKESVQVAKDDDITRERLEREREEEEREQRIRLEKEKREMEREKAKQAVERANREARERAAAEARLKAERAAVQRAQTEARERAAIEARERAVRVAAEKAAAEAKEKETREKEKAAAEAKEKEAREKEKTAVAKAQAEARRRAERAAVERVTAEARERAAAEARERAAAASKMNQPKSENDLDSFFSSRPNSLRKARTNSNDSATDPLSHNSRVPEGANQASSSGVPFPSNVRKASSATNFVDDLSSIFGAGMPAGEFQDVEGETEERRRARLERQQRTQERAAKALAEKNQRDLQVQMEQDERQRISASLDVEIKRWAAGKDGNLRAMLSTLQYVLWPESGWQPVSLTDLITAANVKKVYRKATLCIHPDKVQQKGANLQQKYVAEKVFDLLKEAWNKFNSEELF